MIKFIKFRKRFTRKEENPYISISSCNNKIKNRRISFCYCSYANMQVNYSINAEDFTIGQTICKRSGVGGTYGHLHVFIKTRLSKDDTKTRSLYSVGAKCK